MGTPYRGDEVLDAMRDSTRPGGVPDLMETPEVAARVAESLVTIDGRRWTAFSVGGACGQAECSLEIVGVRDDADGEDIWRFRVEPATGQVEVADHELGATPRPLAEALDRMARRLIEPDLPAALFLASVRWMPPPDDGTFHLVYRSGDEEESCAVDLELDAVRVAIVGVEATDC